MKEKYTTYTAIDLIDDEYFINSTLFPTPHSDLFWLELLSENKINEEVFTHARNTIIALHTNHIVIDTNKIDNIWARIEKTNKDKTKRIYIMLASIASAACILLGIILWSPSIEPSSSINFAELSTGTNIEELRKSEQIQLILPNETIDLQHNDKEVDYTAGDIIKVDDKEVNKQKGINQVVVPYGKRISLILSDGSKLWVNAGTHVIYPSEFANDKREIFVNGEVYADITKDEKRPFTIKSNKLSIRVLGTKFNVSAYDSDEEQSVVLVSGSVEVNSGNNAKERLKPNQLFAIRDDVQSIRNVQASNYIAWIDGYYRFHSERLSNILKYLSKYYGVKIECAQEIAELKCVGGLSLDNNINLVLDGLAFTIPVKYRQLEDGSFRFEKNIE